MGKIVTIVNQKGGVGKTTTCVSLTAALREKGQRVLLCDFDPQANATSGMGVDKSLSLGVYDVLLNDVEPEKRVVSTRYGDVLPSSKGLAGAGVEMVGIQDREHLLRRALERLARAVDLPREEPLDLLRDLQCQIGPAVVHGEQDPLQLQVGIQK